MRLVAWLIWSVGLILPPISNAQVQAGYPRDYAATIAAAKSEGKVVVYAATDYSVAKYLIRDFQTLYPGVKVDYQDIVSNELYNRFVQETGAGTPSADVLWSSAMDLQVKLVNDGYALRYPSPETPSLPEWAVWKSEAYGTTFEPVGIAYNKRKLSQSDVPRTHGELVELLNARPDLFRGKVITYDLERSGLGFLFAAQDDKLSHRFWDLARALGAAETRLTTGTAAMLESLASGETLLGYNLLGSYAYTRIRNDPAIGFIYPQDYTLVVSRIAFISRSAPHPNAARLWLDYLLSRRGQSVMAQQADLFALRSDVEGELSAAALTRKLGRSLRPIAIGPALMTYLDRTKRHDFLRQWRAALEIRPQTVPAAGSGKAPRRMEAHVTPGH